MSLNPEFFPERFELNGDFQAEFCNQFERHTRSILNNYMIKETWHERHWERMAGMNKLAITCIILSAVFIGMFSTIQIVYSQEFASAVTLSDPTPQTFAAFGFSVATGDVNGDGIDDVIVGVPRANTVGGGFCCNAGEVFVFLGPSFTTVKTLTEPTKEVGAQFGSSVATGDVNGDGKDDVIVGAPQADPGGVLSAGEVFVFLGGSPFDTTADFTLTEPTKVAGDRFGDSVATGDVNGDGKDDVIVGARGLDPGGFVNAGGAFVFLGGSPFDTTADFTLTEPTKEAGALFGESIATGDVNGDGKDDVIISNRLGDSGGVADAGEVFVFLGPGLTTVKTLSDPTPEANGLFGNFGSVAAGDVNNDGKDDVVIGSGSADVGRFRDAGEVFVFLGGSPFDTTADFTLTEPKSAAGASFGELVATGDVNRDGKDDVIVGAPRGTAGGFDDAGEVFVFLGSDFETVTILTEPTPEIFADFGSFVATGDVNGDGDDDVIVAAQFGDPGGVTEAGEVFVFESTPEPFAGGGQAAAVNAFLTYFSPTKSSNSLPSGTTEFTMIINYGATIDANTFKATLNRVDITASFGIITAGTSDNTVTISSLDPGRNVLKLSVSGLKPSGATATDTDRFVFKVG